MAGLSSNKHKSPQQYTHIPAASADGTWTAQESQLLVPVYHVGQHRLPGRLGHLLHQGLFSCLCLRTVCVVSPAKAEISPSRLESVGRDRPRSKGLK